MRKVKYGSFIVFLIMLVLFTPSCASTTNAVRYNTSDRKVDKDNSAIRFSSESQKDTLSSSVQIPDTSSNSISDVESDTDDIPPNEKSFDISTLMNKLKSKDERLTSYQITLRDKMLMEIIKYLDTPYKYGGNTSNGIDCSAFTQKIYSKTFSITLLRSAHEQYTEGEPVDEINDLKFGDLVFFNTRRGIKPGHVGIYIGDHLFAHASLSNGVIVSSIDDSYYEKRFMGGRRIKNIFSPNTITRKY